VPYTTGKNYNNNIIKQLSLYAYYVLYNIVYTHYPPVHMRGTMKPPNNSYYTFRLDAIMRPKRSLFFFLHTHRYITILYYNVVFCACRPPLCAISYVPCALAIQSTFFPVNTHIGRCANRVE